MGFQPFSKQTLVRHTTRGVYLALWGGVGRGEWVEVGWGECRDGHASAHRPRWAAQAPAHHVPRTSGRERMEMCANGHRLWPAVATAAAASSACWQHALSAGGTARGQEAGLAGGGVAARLGEVTRAGQTAPESRDADAAAPTRPPALAALAAAARLPAGSQGLLLLLLRARGQVPSGRSRRQGVHCGWIAALQAEDPQPWVLVVPLASLCCPPPTTPSSHLAADRRSSHTRGRNIEVSWPFLVGFSATG